MPPIPVINEAAARFAESASNLGRQIAKVVGELMVFIAIVKMLAVSTELLVFSYSIIHMMHFRVLTIIII